MAGLLDELSPEEWSRVDALLDEALDRTGPGRADFLATLAEQDRARLALLIQRVEGPSAVDRALDLAGQVDPGTVIGSWVLGEALGEGGSSVVFRATHVDGEFPMEAALKLLRKGPGTAPFRERFRRERQILIGLRHPHIVRVLDGGTSRSGQPFYVMERITGDAVTTWAAEQPMRARLELMVQVCGAVEYAHQRLIVHCDLKPENLVVDELGAPRVLDFGIAKLLEDGDEVTQTGYRMLTPRWAAPEQAAGDPVTTATDVYALGLILWATISGRTPREGLTGSALLSEVSRRPLPPPSEAEPLARGDLDAIVAKATSIDPAERYRGAAELAEDLQRHLSGMGVKARERAPLYHAARWVRRHPAAVVTSVVFVSLLGAWAGSATLQSSQLALERDRAQQQAQRAEASLDLLVGMLEAADPAQARGEELTAREVLESSVRELATEQRDPELQGEILLAVGRVQLAVGDAESALKTLSRATQLLDATKGPKDPVSLRGGLHLSLAEFVEDKEGGLARAVRVQRALSLGPVSGDLAEATLHVAEMRGDVDEMQLAYDLARQARTQFEEVGDARGAARAHAVEGYAAIRLEHEGAREVLVEALAEMESALGTSTHPDIADILHELALVHSDEVGREYAARSVALRRKLNGETWALAATLNNYGLHQEKYDPDSAIATLREAVRVAEEIKGPEHPNTVNLRLNLGAVMIDAGQFEEGEDLLRRVLASEAVTDMFRVRANRYLDKLPGNPGAVDPNSTP